MVKTFFILFLILGLQSCNSGGGGSSLKPEKKDPEIVDFDPDIIPNCSQPAAKIGADGFPFHAKGRRSGQNYYLICTANQLAVLSSAINFYQADFELGNDIDLFYFYTGDYGAGPNNQFMIGTEENPFMGSFNGNGYTISDFRYVNSSEDFCGLFAHTDGALILNLDLESARITSSMGICAPLIGKAIDSVVEYVSISYYDQSESPFDFIYWNFVEGPQVAGLIGLMDNSVISASYSSSNLITTAFENAQAAGFALSMINNSFIFDSFYVGATDFDANTQAGAITLYSPSYENFLDEGESEAILIKNIVYSAQSGFAQACIDDINCKGEEIQVVDLVENPNYFLDLNNQPMQNWFPGVWNFSSSGNYPFPLLF